MAWDHTLALECGPEEGILRFYSWDRPTLSLGRNEPALGAYLEDRLEAEGVGLVRRPTGGRAVLHHRELTYAVCLPLRALGGARQVYVRVNQALAEGLRQLGAPAGLAGPGPTAAPDAGPCFREPAEGEVMAPGPDGGEAKLVGSAQARVGGAILQHGSILLGDDQARIAAFRTGAGSTGDRPATLTGVLGRDVPLDELRAALIRSFCRVVPGDWTAVSPKVELGPTDPPTDPRPELLARYRSREWTWRR